MRLQILSVAISTLGPIKQSILDHDKHLERLQDMFASAMLSAKAAANHFH
jgi:hypothetical protein